MSDTMKATNNVDEQMSEKPKVETVTVPKELLTQAASQIDALEQHNRILSAKLDVFEKMVAHSRCTSHYGDAAIGSSRYYSMKNDLQAYASGLAKV